MDKPVPLLLFLTLGCRACDVGWRGGHDVQVVDEREFFEEYLEINWANLVTNIACVQSVAVELALNRDGRLGGSSRRTEREASTLRGDPLAMENLFQYTDCQEAPYFVNVTIRNLVGREFVHSTTLDPMKLFDPHQLVVKQKPGSPVAIVQWTEKVFKDLRLRTHCLRGGRLVDSKNVLVQELDIMYPEVKVPSTSCKEQIYCIQYDIGDPEKPKQVYFSATPDGNCTNDVEETTSSGTTGLREQANDKTLPHSVATVQFVQYVRAEDEEVDGGQVLQVAGVPIFGIASCSAMIVIIFSLVGLIVFVRVKRKRREEMRPSYNLPQETGYNDDHGSYGRYTMRSASYDGRGGFRQQSFSSSSISRHSREGDVSDEEFVGDVVAVVDNRPYYHVGPIEVTEL